MEINVQDGKSPRARVARPALLQSAYNRRFMLAIIKQNKKKYKFLPGALLMQALHHDSDLFLGLNLVLVSCPNAPPTCKYKHI